MITFFTSWVLNCFRISRYKSLLKSKPYIAILLLSLSACSLPRHSQDEPAAQKSHADLIDRVAAIPKTTEKPVKKDNIVKAPAKEYPAFPKFDDIQMTDLAASQSPNPPSSLQRSTRMKTRPTVAEVQIPNPVDIVRQAGATPPSGASRGEYMFGYWTAKGVFPLRTERYIKDDIETYSFKNIQERDEHVADRVSDDKTRILISKNKPFYAILNTYGDEGFTIDPEIIADRLNASIKP